MSAIHVIETADIDAPPTAVYDIIADYRVGHPAILPPAYFQDVRVVAGGTGVGTTIQFKMNMMGVKQPGVLTVTEAERGRYLKEISPDGTITTYFRFEPLNDGARTRITFDTTMQISGGVRGVIERLMVPGYLRRVYHEELTLLAAYTRQTVSAT